jgi:hypothetical protein
VKSALPAAEAAVKILKKEELFMLLKTGTFHVAPTEIFVE